MLLTITSTQAPATDLGYLLHKHPDRAHACDLSFGRADVFYPEATDERCTAALLITVDPVELVRGARQLEDYVNDRPYVASSFTSVAIARLFGTALSGRCKQREELVHQRLPLTAEIAAIEVRGGLAILECLFTPLGYTLEAKRLPLDVRFPEWGESNYYHVRLSGQQTVHDLLSHLYVLLPVLDDDKHYYIGDAEVDKLLRHGEGWLAAHPERDSIVQRYLQRRSRLTRDALRRLVPEESALEQQEEAAALAEHQLEQPMTLHTQRLHTVAETLKAHEVRRVLDLGCGEGKLLRRLIKDPFFQEILGTDVSYRSLEIARDRIGWERLTERQRQRVSLIQGSLVYRDERLWGYDGAAVVEVIEHLDPPRLASFERVLFGVARPRVVVLTTPNREYNRLWPTLPEGRMRHGDHRFEWTRDEFRQWAQRVSNDHHYAVDIQPVGPEDPEAGAPTQMAVFVKKEQRP